MAKSKTSITERQWLTVGEVQDYAPLGERTVRGLIKDGLIRSSKPKRGPTLVKKEWVDAYLESEQCIMAAQGNEVEEFFKEITGGR